MISCYYLGIIKLPLQSAATELGQNVPLDQKLHAQFWLYVNILALEK